MRSDLTPGVQVYGRDMPPSAFDLDWTVISNITHTIYQFGTPGVGVSFLAPQSGRVLISVGCGTRNNSAANSDRLSVTYILFEDSADGVVVFPAELRSGVLLNGAAIAGDYHYVGGFKMETGLTPGKQYYAGMQHRTTLGSGTCDIASRNIAVIPMT